jgi:hypothetical protein
MMELQTHELILVSGGNPTAKAIEAITIAAQIYESTSCVLDYSQSSIVQSTETYAIIGRHIGKLMYDVAHPNPLGKMIFYPSDFSK